MQENHIRSLWWLHLKKIHVSRSREDKDWIVIYIESLENEKEKSTRSVCYSYKVIIVHDVVEGL